MKSKTTGLFLFFEIYFKTASMKNLWQKPEDLAQRMIPAGAGQILQCHVNVSFRIGVFIVVDPRFMVLAAKFWRNFQDHASFGKAAGPRQMGVLGIDAGCVGTRMRIQRVLVTCCKGFKMI